MKQYIMQLAFLITRFQGAPLCNIDDHVRFDQYIDI